MAFEFLPPEINWSTHCGDAPTFGRFSTMFDYPTKAITQAAVYPKEAYYNATKVDMLLLDMLMPE